MAFMKPHIALYQPDIPQNTGALIRLCACMDFALDIIEPCGFPLDDRKLQRAAMDYQAFTIRHACWEDFLNTYKDRDIVLLTTKTTVVYTDHTFRPDTILLFGRESAGVPENVHNKIVTKLTIPMASGQRSLNLAQSAAMVAGEAQRQLERVIK